MNRLSTFKFFSYEDSILVYLNVPLNDDYTFD